MAKTNTYEIVKPSLLDTFFGNQNSIGENRNFQINDIFELFKTLIRIDYIQFVFKDNTLSNGSFTANDDKFQDINSIKFNTKSLSSNDLTLLFTRLGEIENITIEFRNPNDINNFVVFKIISIEINEEEIILEVETYQDFYFGNFNLETIYSLYFDIKSNSFDKTDKGGFEGSSQDLNEDIQRRVVKVVGKSLVSDSEIEKLENLDNTKDIDKPISTQQAAAIALRLLSGGYTGSGQDLYNLIVSATTGVTGAAITPISTPTGSGIASWVTLEAGTYTNFGGVVVNASSLAVISRDASNNYSVTQTPIVIPDENYVKYTTDNDDFIIKDEDGNIALWISSTGVFEIAKLGAGTVELVKAAIGDSIVIPDSNNFFQFADINHIITYGQSLSVGQSEVVISSSSYPNLLTFGNSVLTSPYSEDYPANLNSFGPLKERTYTATPLLKETPTTGTCEKLLIDLLSSNLNFNNTTKLLGSAPGQGATTISQLSKGTSYYSRVLADVTSGKNNSELLGKTYKCYAVTWTQGESDYISGTSKSSYKSLLKQLSIDLNNDIKAITGQSEDIRLIIYQTATIADYAETPTIALAQYELAIETDNIIEMGTSMYFMEYNDNFHLKAAYSKLLGIYYGKALSKKSFKPIYPITHLVKGNNIELVFNVPQKPLVFESLTTSSTITNQGFEVIKSGVNILTNVELMGDGVSVKLLCSESPVGSEIRYAFQKGITTPNKRNMGFLRDSEGINNQYEIEGVVYLLNNWCPIFNYNL